MRKNGKTLDLALSLYNKLMDVPEGTLVGILRKSKALFITKQQVMPVDYIQNKIYILEKIHKEFPKNEEIRIKIITLKELLEGYSKERKKYE